MKAHLRPKSITKWVHGPLGKDITQSSRRLPSWVWSFEYWGLQGPVFVWGLCGFRVLGLGFEGCGSSFESIISAFCPRLLSKLSRNH